MYFFCFCFTGNYVKFIWDDYMYVFQEIGKDMKAYPFKTTAYLSVLGGFVTLWKTNPGEREFREQLTLNSHKLLQLGEAIRNPYADIHMQKIHEFYNSGRIRRLSIGFCSIMWVDNYHSEVDVYIARCKPLRVGWLNLKDKVIDIGVLNRWWLLESAMKDYDVNPQEWNEKDERVHPPGIQEEIQSSQ